MHAAPPGDVRRAIRDALPLLSSAGIASARVDAEILAAFVLDVPRGRLPLAERMTDAQAARFDSLVAARARRVPLQHLTGTAGFHRLALAVGPGVFVPRPETELLVEWGLAALAGSSAPLVVDLCSGSGAIALAVASERPDATVYAVERDPAALVWLRRNAGDRVRVVAGDATDPSVLSTMDGRVDLVLCNPPYVPDDTPVTPEVTDHDPAAAVFAGPDGLDVIRGVLRRAAALLRSGGAFGVEHDESHAPAVSALMRDRGAYRDIELYRDLAGRPRFTTARRLADCMP